MAELTLQQAAGSSGQSYAALRKAAQRGKIKTRREGSVLVVDETDLAAYVAAQRIAEAAAGTGKGMPVMREVGNAIGKLPQEVRDAILDGIPTSGRGGHPGRAKRWHEETDQLSKAEFTPSGDPHEGFPIGYQHATEPRWKRISDSTWKLEDATLSWNGFVWEGGGAYEGRSFEPNVSPADTWSSRRPVAPRT